MKPIEDSPPCELAALDGLDKFAGAVADYGHAFIGLDTLLHQKVIQTSRGADNPLTDVSNHFGGSIGTCRTTGDNVHLAAAESGAYAMLEPGRIDANRRHLSRFDGLIGGISLGHCENLTLDPRV